MARKKKTEAEELTEIILPEEKKEELKKKLNDEYGLDSNRALKLEIIDQIEKINNRYYLLIVKKYIDNLGV